MINPDLLYLWVSKLRKNIDLYINLRYFNKRRDLFMRYFTLIIFFLFLSGLVNNDVFAQEKTNITKVVIDAGHGGKDPGTIGKKAQEKNIALQIALKLSEDIRNRCKGVTVILTRTTDEFIELHERAEIANRSKADLFISIHCNSNPKHTFQGAETYVMGLHRTEANLEIAKKENASILMEPDYSTRYNGFDPNSDESYITFTLFQNAYLEQSTKFASFVQDEMKDRVGMNDRGVRQAGFLVLYKTTMPSVLIETVFLSNPDEEKFLMSDKGQEYIASAICRAFIKFKARQEGNGKELASANPKKTGNSNTNLGTITIKKEAPKTETNIAEPEVQRDTIKPKEKSTESSYQHDVVKPKEKTPEGVVKHDLIKPKEEPSETIAEDKSFTPKEKPKESPVQHNVMKPKEVSKELHPVKEVEKKKETTKPVATQKPVIAAKSETQDAVVFRVQFATSSKELSVHSSKFEGVQDVWMYEHQGLYKYTTGKASSPEALSGILADVKQKGFADAFIVAFHNGERISVADAKKLISEMHK